MANEMFKFKFDPPSDPAANLSCEREMTESFAVCLYENRFYHCGANMALKQ